MAGAAAALGVAAAAAMVAVYMATDPLGLSPMAEFPGFETYAVDLQPPSDVHGARDTLDRLRNADIRFSGQLQGPESIAFDPLGRGPYTGVADGRVVFWNGESWTDFAVTSPNRSELCGLQSSSHNYLKHEHICGRPLGLRFDKKSGDLYIADAYFGILKAGPEGGLATPLTTEAEGVPFKFTNDLDIDEKGNIYFTDSSTTYQRRNYMQVVLSGDPSGRLLKYNPVTMETTVLLRGLQFPNGVTLSKDGSFLVFCEGMRSRLSRYWIKGQKEATYEVFVVLPGSPDNVRTNAKGEFWVAIHARESLYTRYMAAYPKLRKLLLKLPVPTKYHYLLRVGGRPHAMILKYSPEAELLDVLEDRQGKVVRATSEVEEKDGELWIGSVLMPFIAVYPLRVPY